MITIKVENHCHMGMRKPFLVCFSQNRRVKILWLLEHAADVKPKFSCVLMKGPFLCEAFEYVNGISYFIRIKEKQRNCA